MLSLIRLAKEILGRSNPNTPPMDLLEKVTTFGNVARISGLTFFAYQTFPLYVSIYKLRQEQNSLRRFQNTLQLEYDKLQLEYKKLEALEPEHTDLEAKERNRQRTLELEDRDFVAEEWLRQRALENW